MLQAELSIQVVVWTNMLTARPPQAGDAKWILTMSGARNTVISSLTKQHGISTLVPAPH